MLEAVDEFRCAVESRLKSKSCLPLPVKFPSYVFRYLFEGKGDASGGGSTSERKILTFIFSLRTGINSSTTLEKDMLYAIQYECDISCLGRQRNLLKIQMGLHMSAQEPTQRGFLSLC